MAIQGVKATSSVQISKMMRARFSAGKLTLPLRQPTIFARFKHVVGVPSGHSGEGFSIHKLRILDTLIDRLAKLKTDSQKNENVDVTGLSPKALDAMIESMKQELHTLVKQNEVSVFPKTGIDVSGGTILSQFA